MSQTRVPTAAEARSVPPPRPTRSRRRRRTVVTVLAVTVALAALAYVVVDPAGGTGTADPGVEDNAAPTARTTVTRRSLTAQTNVDATLGYAGSYTIVNQAQGTITALPDVGAVVSQGEVLYRVDGAPVVLLYGTTPAYRALAAGAKASDVTGADVAALNANLVALGYATSAELDPTSDQLGWQTKRAVKKLQDHLGVPQTGSLDFGSVVFLPTSARISSLPESVALGGPTQPGAPTLLATSTVREVTIKLKATRQGDVAVGDQVTLTLPNNQTTPGTVTSVGSVATASTSEDPRASTPTVVVVVTPSDPAATGTLDQAPVQASIVNASVENVLVVPVNALLALAGGGYAVEVADGDTRALLPVTLGLTDDANGLVEVSGAGLVEGQSLVVPAS